MAINIKSRREFFWDNYLVDENNTTATIKLHKPQYRGTGFVFDAPWEGSISYTHIVKIDNKYRMYYMAGANEKYHVCCLLSDDGQNWMRPKLGLREFDGSFDNNIVITSDDIELLDNFYVFYDTTGNGAKFKALGRIVAKNPVKDDEELWFWQSDDGFNFTCGGKVTAIGAFDTLNTVHWEEENQRYVCYIRGFHLETGELLNNGGWDNDGVSIRDVRVLYSKDFAEWTHPEILKYVDEDGEPGEDMPMYTNNVLPYYRGEHIKVGFPTRYTEHKEWTDNFEKLCDKDIRKKKMEKHKLDRIGLAVTDCLFMCSRDGINWTRFNEAFLTPGPEHSIGWAYGDCYPTMGFIEIPGDHNGSDKQLCITTQIGHNCDIPETSLKYTMRIDGYVSRHATYKPQKVVTKTFIFEGDTLEMNFATSAAGYMYITLTDEDGNSIKSCKIFGDKVDRIIGFDGDLSEFSGKPVVMKIDMSDADVYSFRFFNK